MKYPKIWRRFNEIIGAISGFCIFITAVFAVIEVIMRTVFNSPTRWSLTFSEYILLYSIFFGVSYSLQGGGQVAVDMLRDFFKKHNYKMALRATGVLTQVICMAVAGVLAWQGARMCEMALKYNKLTIASIQIPEFALDIAIVVGSAILFITSFFMLLDVISGSDEYL